MAQPAGNPEVTPSGRRFDPTTTGQDPTTTRQRVFKYRTMNFMVDRRVTGLGEGSLWRCSHKDSDGVRCQHVLRATAQPPAHNDHPNCPMTPNSVQTQPADDEGN